MTEKPVCGCCDEGEFAQIAEMEDETVLCRCEEITIGTVRKWIAEGYDTFDELKRLLRVGMGPCQRHGCRNIVLREICRATGIPINKIPPRTIRPPYARSGNAPGLEVGPDARLCQAQARDGQRWATKRYISMKHLAEMSVDETENVAG